MANESIMLKSEHYHHVYPGLFGVDTCIWTKDRKVFCVLRNLQQGRRATETWYKGWNIIIEEDAIGMQLGLGAIETLCERRNVNIVDLEPLRLNLHRMGGISLSSIT
jgi:hypothetical protein